MSTEVFQRANLQPICGTSTLVDINQSFLPSSNSPFFPRGNSKPLHSVAASQVGLSDYFLTQPHYVIRHLFVCV